MTGLWSPSLPPIHFIIRGTAVYLCVLGLLRLGGKRQVGQMGTAEFVALLLISNAVQNSMTGGDNSITGGLVLAGVIVGLSTLAAYLSYRHKTWENILQGHPALLAYKGEPVHKNLESERINYSELKTMLRRQGIHNLDDIHEAVLESNGTLSVVKKSELKKHPSETR